MKVDSCICFTLHSSGLQVLCLFTLCVDLEYKLYQFSEGQEVFVDSQKCSVKGSVTADVQGVRLLAVKRL